MIEALLGVPEEILLVFDILRKYPGYWMHSSKISKDLLEEGIHISPQGTSKILLKLYKIRNGEVERLVRGHGQNLRVYYRLKK